MSTRLVNAGPVQVEVLVRRSGLPDATRSFTWTIGGAQVHTRSAVVSTAPIGGVLERAAAILGLLLAAFALWVLVRSLRRRRRPLAPDHKVPIALVGPPVGTRASR